MGFDAQRLIAGLLAAATVLFLVAQAPGMRYRRAARVVAVAVYGALFVGVAVWVALWALGLAPGW